MWTRLIFCVLLAGCVNEQTQEPAKPKTGACEYSWYSGGWTTWCYDSYEETTCLNFKVGSYESLKMWSQDKTCASLGYTFKCMVFSKKTACKSYE